MMSQLLVALVIEALDRGLLDSPVHSFNLAVRPRMFRFGQAMVDIVSGAGELKSMSPEELSSCNGLLDLGDRQATTARNRELDAIVRENRVDLVGHGRDKVAQELGCYSCRGFLMQFDESEFARPINGNEEV